MKKFASMLQEVESSQITRSEKGLMQKLKAIPEVEVEIVLDGLADWLRAIPETSDESILEVAMTEQLQSYPRKYQASIMMAGAMVLSGIEETGSADFLKTEVLDNIARIAILEARKITKPRKGFQ